MALLGCGEDPYRLAFNSYRDAQQAHPNDNDYAHPDFDRALELLKGVPKKKKARWEEAQKLVKNIEVVRQEAARGVLAKEEAKAQEEASKEKVRRLRERRQKVRNGSAAAEGLVDPQKLNAGIPGGATLDGVDPKIKERREKRQISLDCRNGCYQAQKRCTNSCGSRTEQSACYRGCYDDTRTCTSRCYTLK